MPDLPGIPPASYEHLVSDHTAADRARQLDEAIYAQAITSPENSERYRNDLGFRMEIDLYRHALHAMDRALADGGVTLEQRNRALGSVIDAREPYRGVDIASGQAAPITLPHGPFSITVEPAAIVDGEFVQQALVVHCACGWSHKWKVGVAGGDLLAWLRDHPAQKAQHEAANRRQPFDWPDGWPLPRKDQADG